MKKEAATFGREIRALRSRLRLSQGEFGKQLGVSQGAVGQLERGESQPSRRLLVALRAIFGVEQAPDGLFRILDRQQERGRPDADEDPSSLDPEWRRAIDYLRTIFRCRERKWWLGIMANLEALAAQAGGENPREVQPARQRKRAAG